MAHITLKLIWYRLGETFDKMAAASENITAWLDWDDHLLDFLLIGWIGWAALVVVVVNSVLTFFGPLQPRGDFVVRTKEGATGAKVVAGTGGAESCQWLNSALNWFYLHYDKFPEFVDVWVKALNDQSVKLGGPVQVKFERVKSGSLPPKFSEVTFEAGPENKYVVTCKTDSRDVSLAVFASQQTAEGVKLTNLTTNILKLKGTLKMKCFREGSDMMVNVSFEGRPDVKVVGKPVNPYQDPNDLVDVGVVETVVRNAICLTSSNFNISKLLLGGSYGNLSPRVVGDPPLSPSNLSPKNEAVFEPIEVKEVQQSAFHAPSLAAAPRTSRPPPGEKRLLVKVIKASALGSRDVGSIDPTCVVILDNPPQTQATSVVKSTVNPFWDEQFLFDVSSNTREMKFEVRDRRRPAGENFLGEAFVYYEDLKRTPSSRQIIPLQGILTSGVTWSPGSLTVEFLFLDPVEAEAVRQTIAAMSPKRTVEVNQAKTPGGTLVTKTTTTTERSRHGRQGAEVDGSPNYIEKHTNIYDYDGSDSHSLNTSTIPQERSVSSSSEHLHINGVESVAETAIRELMDRSRKPRTPTKTSTLIITGVKRDSDKASDKASEEKTESPSTVTVPQDESPPVEETTVSSDAVEPVKSLPTIKQTTQSSPTEEVNTDIPTVRMDPPPSGHDEKEKKKGSSLARTIKKRFSRSKKRSKSAERSRDDSHLQPPDQSYGQAQSKDDIELVRAQPDTPSLKKSRSLGGSLKKLFRRGRKRSRDRGETSRESSYSRSSTRNASQGPSREGSITRGGSASLTRSGQLPDQKGEVGRSHWSKSNTQSTSNEYLERGVDVSPRHQPTDTTYPVLQQEPTVLQPRGMSSHEPDVGRGHWSRPKSGEQMDIVRQSYDTNSAPPESQTASEDVRRGHWSKSKSPPRAGAVVITTPKNEPLDVVTPSYDTMTSPPEDKLEVRRGHWSKSKSPSRSVGGVVITTPRQEVPDVVSSSSTKVISPEVKEIKEVNGKAKSVEKLDNGHSAENSVSSAEPAEDVGRRHWSKSKTPVQSGPVIVKKRESTEIDTTDKPEVITTTAEVSSVQPEVRRGHWSKSKSPSRERDRERIGQIIVSKDPVTAAPPAEADIRKGHWTKSKSKSPKQESFPNVGVETSVPDNQTSSPARVESPPEVKPSPVTESSDSVKVKAKPTKVEPVKSKPVKVVPIKAKQTKVEATVEEPAQTVPDDPIVTPPPSAKKGHWSKSTIDSNQPSGGGVVVVTTEIAEVPVVQAEPLDVRRGHWTKPKSKTS
ncbi:LOW QUALITY PROTEIN: phospholipid transfer protein C2CD2L-like [Pecten maximus]|uniref:LOW QUALITY PROTEIN: phospholipid transfer protein C2CD2L-like n=1 Tax=Pecten maximus TaxID=6579 RepID=UPI001458BC76|nr:LOW QUALITY PROTEIN: phospholipid transfer protein C2CD2L-like [Pecten maximus]